MLIYIKNLWKHSRFRFYILNAIWNYKFWLFAKKMYKTVSYQVEDGEYMSDVYYSVKRQKKTISKKRFIGYYYKGNIYLDNPGFKIDDHKTWNAWKQKRLVD